MRAMSPMVVLAGAVALLATAVASDPQPAQVNVSVEAARRDAEGTHAVVEAMLHAVHHHYYREGERLPPPAAAFREVFARIAEQRGVTLRWLAVEGAAMNVEHEPRDDFERKAAQAIRAGEKSFERVEDGVYRRAGAVALTNVCIKCHVPDRKTVEERNSGLIVAVPLTDGRKEQSSAPRASSPRDIVREKR